MYWSDWGAPAKIERASMDGSNREILHDTDLIFPSGLAIDYDLQRLYWADSYYRRIEFSGVDGHRREVLLYVDFGSPFAITISGDQIYWSNLTHILRAHKQVALSTAIVYSESFSLALHGIKVVDSSRQDTDSKRIL